MNFYRFGFLASGLIIGVTGFFFNTGKFLVVLDIHSNNSSISPTLLCIVMYYVIYGQKRVTNLYLDLGYLLK